MSAPDDGAPRVVAELTTWRLRREATTASWDALQERLRAQRTVCEALRDERVRTRATALRLAAECTVLRDAARAERDREPPGRTRAPAAA